METFHLFAFIRGDLASSPNLMVPRRVHTRTVYPPHWGIITLEMPSELSSPCPLSTGGMTSHLMDEPLIQDRQIPH